MRKGASIKASMGLCRRAQRYIMDTSLKVAIIQWDILLDVLEDIIRREKCIGCRAVLYHHTYHLLAVDTINALGAHKFEHAYKAYHNLLNLSRVVMEVQKTTRFFAHQQSHGNNKAFIRELADAETKLMVALHYHPLIKDAHLCYMCYADAFRYNVDPVVCDEQFQLVQTMEYVERLRKMQRLFE